MIFLLVLLLILIIYCYKQYIIENYSINYTSNKIIYNLIKKNKNFSIARCGNREFQFAFDYMFNKNTSVPDGLHNNAGIYFDDSIKLSKNEYRYDKEQYSKLYLDAIRTCDYLASWFQSTPHMTRIIQRELYFINKYNLKYIPAQILDFQDVKIPWTYALKNKKVLIIHPYSNLIKSQYKKRKFLFKNKKILPKFKLKTMKAINTINSHKIGKNWYENYEAMCNKIDKIDFDISLVSCGGYGHPIINYIKNIKKKSAIYVGGSLQLLFGIKGKRWDNRHHSTYYNKYWIRPEDKITSIENIDGLRKTEDGAYL